MASSTDPQTLDPQIKLFFKNHEKGSTKNSTNAPKTRSNKTQVLFLLKNSIFNIFGGVLGGKMESKTILRDDGPQKRVSPFHTVKTILI